MKKLTTRFFEELPGIFPDQVVKRGDSVTFRRGFFYGSWEGSEKWRDQVESALTAAGIKYKLEDYGIIQKPFKGGASVSKQSHWWVQVTLVASVAQEAR